MILRIFLMRYQWIFLIEYSKKMYFLLSLANSFSQVPLSQVPSSGTQPTSASGSFYGISQLSHLATGYTGPSHSPLSSAVPLIRTQKEQLLPERPGQPDCQHYLKTGECKFGSSCKYHHPPDLIAPNTNIIISATPFHPVGIYFLIVF